MTKTMSFNFVMLINQFFDAPENQASKSLQFLVIIHIELLHCFNDINHEDNACVLV